MKLVVDTNVAFSLLKKDSFTKKLAKKHSLKLYSHPFILEELSKYSELLCSKLKISEDKFERIKEILSKLINLKVKVSPQQLNWADSLLSDSDDKQYLALAIKLHCPIWSEDSHFKEQSLVKVFTTSELKDFLEEE